MKLIDAEPIIKFITDGLNDTENPMGHDAIKILTEIQYAPKVDAEPVIHSHWIHTGEYLTNSDGERLMKLREFYVCHRCYRVEEVPEPYCNCGAKMDEEMKEDNYED